MKITLISYKLASWSLVFVGIGHTITDLTSPKTATQNEFLQQMKEFTLNILGVETSIFSFHQGYSLMMGLLLFGYGVLNLMILKNNQKTPIASNIILFNILISIISVVLSVQYFFFVPIVFTSIALFGFIISMLTKKINK